MSDSQNIFNDLEIPVKDKTGNFEFLKIGSLDPGQEEMPVTPAIPVSAGPTTAPDMGSQQAKARYYVDSEDEQEVAKFQPNEVTISPDDLQKEAVMVTEVLHPELKDEEKEKFVKITFSLLKGIRNPRQAREVFMREPSLGGLGLLQTKAQEYVDEIMAKKDAIYTKLKGEKLAKDLASPEEPKPAGKIEDIYDTAAKPAVVEKDKLVTEVKPRSEASGFTPKPVQSGDVSYTPRGKVRPSGPIEELQSLTLEDFRRLAKTPADAAQRVYQKIELLADESLELKAQAIKGWKKSPAYQDYLAIGHKSMEGESSVDDIIKNKLVNDMTEEEFTVIADLNKSLQF